MTDGPVSRERHHRMLSAAVLTSVALRLIGTRVPAIFASSRTPARRRVTINTWEPASPGLKRLWANGQ